MVKKVSANSRRSPCFLAETCRRLFNKNQLRNPISLFSLFLVVVVVVMAPGAVSTLMRIAGTPAKNKCDQVFHKDQVTNPILLFLLYLVAVVAVIVAVAILTWRSIGDVQVFLNFRGEELRNNFVSHLTEDLGRNQINFFIDKNEERGKDLRNLFVRIKQSKIALAIFSPRYSESKWCMNELVKMKNLADKRKLIVIPIFYKVKAEDVRKPTIDNEFGRNFWKLTKTRNQIKKWKEALECISYKMGLSIGNESSEADFVKEIVKEVKRVIEGRR